MDPDNLTEKEQKMYDEAYEAGLEVGKEEATRETEDVIDLCRETARLFPKLLDALRRRL